MSVQLAPYLKFDILYYTLVLINLQPVVLINMQHSRWVCETQGTFFCISHRLLRDTEAIFREFSNKHVYVIMT